MATGATADSTLASSGIGDGTNGATETMDDVLASGDTGATTDIAEPEIEIPELDLEGTSETQPEKQVEQPIDARTTPESFKQALRAAPTPEAKAELQRIWNSYQAYTAQFKTPAEARQFKELVGEGGVERVKQLIDSAADYEQRDAAFFSGDPAQQEPQIIEWLQHDPNAVYSAFQTTNNLIKTNFPEEYAKFSSEVARDTLNRFSDGDFGDFMESMGQAAATGDPAKMAPFAAELARWWSKTGPKLGYGKKEGLNGNDPAQMQLAKQREQFERQRNDFSQTQWKTFQSGFHDQMETQIGSLSKTIVDKALEKAVVTDGLKARIKADLGVEIRKAVLADKTVSAQIQRLIDPSGKRNVSQYSMTPDVSKQVVSLLTGRARAVARDVAKRVISGWTNDIVGRRKEEISSRQRAAQRPDVSGGAPSNWGKAGSLTDKEIAEKGMSMDDVLADPRPYAGKGKRS